MRRRVDGELRDVFGFNHRNVPECLLRPLPLKTKTTRGVSSENVRTRLCDWSRVKGVSQVTEKGRKGSKESRHERSKTKNEIGQSREKKWLSETKYGIQEDCKTVKMSSIHDEHKFIELDDCNPSDATSEAENIHSACVEHHRLSDIHGKEGFDVTSVDPDGVPRQREDSEECLSVEDMSEVYTLDCRTDTSEGKAEVLSTDEVEHEAQVVEEELHEDIPEMIGFTPSDNQKDGNEQPIGSKEEIIHRPSESSEPKTASDVTGDTFGPMDVCGPSTETGIVPLKAICYFQDGRPLKTVLNADAVSPVTALYSHYDASEEIFEISKKQSNQESTLAENGVLSSVHDKNQLSGSIAELLDETADITDKTMAVSETEIDTTEEKPEWLSKKGANDLNPDASSKEELSDRHESAVSFLEEKSSMHSTSMDDPALTKSESMTKTEVSSDKEPCKDAVPVNEVDSLHEQCTSYEDERLVEASSADALVERRPTRSAFEDANAADNLKPKCLIDDGQPFVESTSEISDHRSAHPDDILRGTNQQNENSMTCTDVEETELSLSEAGKDAKADHDPTIEAADVRDEPSMNLVEEEKKDHRLMATEDIDDSEQKSGASPCQETKPAKAAILEMFSAKNEEAIPLIDATGLQDAKCNNPSLKASGLSTEQAERELSKSSAGQASNTEASGREPIADRQPPTDRPSQHIKQDLLDDMSFPVNSTKPSEEPMVSQAPDEVDETAYCISTENDHTLKQLSGKESDKPRSPSEVAADGDQSSSVKLICRPSEGGTSLLIDLETEHLQEEISKRTSCTCRLSSASQTIDEQSSTVNLVCRPSEGGTSLLIDFETEGSHKRPTPMMHPGDSDRRVGGPVDDKGTPLLMESNLSIESNANEMHEIKTPDTDSDLGFDIETEGHPSKAIDLLCRSSEGGTLLVIDLKSREQQEEQISATDTAERDLAHDTKMDEEPESKVDLICRPSIGGTSLKIDLQTSGILERQISTTCPMDSTSDADFKSEEHSTRVDLICRPSQGGTSLKIDLKTAEVDAADVRDSDPDHVAENTETQSRDTDMPMSSIESSELKTDMTLEESSLDATDDAQSMESLSPKEASVRIKSVGGVVEEPMNNAVDEPNSGDEASQMLLSMEPDLTSKSDQKDRRVIKGDVSDGSPSEDQATDKRLIADADPKTEHVSDEENASNVIDGDEATTDPSPEEFRERAMGDSRGRDSFGHPSTEEDSDDRRHPQVSLQTESRLPSDPSLPKKSIFSSAFSDDDVEEQKSMDVLGTGQGISSVEETTKEDRKLDFDTEHAADVLEKRTSKLEAEAEMLKENAPYVASVLQAQFHQAEHLMEMIKHHSTSQDIQDASTPETNEHDVERLVDLAKQLKANVEKIYDQPPTEEEIHEFAIYLGPPIHNFNSQTALLGMDIEADREYLYIAEWAMTAPLPAGWSVHLDAQGNEYFYHKPSKTSQYEHPMDQHYRRLYHQLKSIEQIS